MKRVFDFIVSLVGLTVLSPVFIVIASWIKLDSPGPVYYRQVRVGLNSAPFRIHKFRTMNVNAELNGGRLTVGTDSRITRSGHFLRKYKLDELPQLIDVLLGRMSLVGPRPEVKEFMDEYPADIQKKVLSVRPGITDLASLEMMDENQLLGKYEDARQGYINIILPIKQKYYLDYIEQHNFWTDLKIIFLTLRKIVSR